MSSTVHQGVSYLSQADAIAVDEKLMGPLGFSIDQLMELAGLSVACALHEVFPPTSHPRVLVLAGPGNNGGDGLVAARHLRHFGFFPEICYPKPTDRPIYNGLVTQCKALGLPFKTAEEVLAAPLQGSLQSVLQSVIAAAAPGLQEPPMVRKVLSADTLGCVSQGEPRPPFDMILASLAPPASPPPIVSVDIPSGWDVENGDVRGQGIRPQLLVSLTAPKLCARSFEGPHHFLGGRFVPPSIATEYGLQLPAFAGATQTVRIAPPRL